MNCACHKMTEVVIQHGCTEIRLHPSQCTEGAFRAGICCWHNQNNLDQEHDLWYEGPDILFLNKSATLCNVPPTPSPCLKLIGLLPANIDSWIQMLSESNSV